MVKCTLLDLLCLKGHPLLNCFCTRMLQSGKYRTWAESYVALVKFKVEFGHCIVPQTYKTDVALGNWVNRVRANWIKLEPLQKSLLIIMGFLYQKWTKQMNFC